MIETKHSRQWVANSMRPPLPFTKIVRALPVKLHVAPNIDRSPVYTMLLANHDLNEPYMAWKLSQFQQSQLSTLHKKLNIAVEVRVPLAILKTRLSESSPSSPQTIEDLIDLVDRALATQLQELALL